MLVSGAKRVPLIGVSCPDHRPHQYVSGTRLRRPLAPYDLRCRLRVWTAVAGGRSFRSFRAYSGSCGLVLRAAGLAISLFHVSAVS